MNELEEFVVSLIWLVVTITVLATAGMAAYRVLKWVWLG